MISIRPITSRLSSRILGTSLSDTAERSIELAPETSIPVMPPIMLDGEVERIRSHHVDCRPDDNAERLTRDMLRQGPTRIHLLRNAIIANGTLLGPNFFDRIAPARKRFILRGDLEHVPEAALCSTFLIHKYFGHWLREGLALEQLASDLRLRPLVVDQSPWLHEASYRDLLDMRARRVSLAWCDRLWVAEDRRFNRHFIERYERLRERLRAAIGPPSPSGVRAFISRGKMSQGRRLANEDEVQSALSRCGFVLLDPECMEARDIAIILANARLVVSPEGSAMAHAAIAMPRGSGLITIIGAQHFNMPYKDVADIIGFRFGLTIADAVDADSYSQPVDRLLRTIDLVDKAVDGSDHAGRCR
jgi:hypothetical protein